MRFGFLLAASIGGCGYEPYTPEAVDRFGSLYCSDAEGEASGVEVLVQVTALFPVEITHFDADCLADARILVETAAEVSSPPGGRWHVAEAVGGGFVGAFQVPLDAVGTWAVTVPP